MKRETFLFYRSYYEAIKSLPQTNQINLYTAIFGFIYDDIEPTLEGIEKTVWILILPLLKVNKRNYINASKPRKAKAKPEPSHSEAKTEPEPKQCIRLKVKGIRNKEECINTNTLCSETPQSSVSSQHTKNTLGPLPPSGTTNKDNKQSSVKLPNLIPFWCEKYKDKTGKQYIVTGKDAGLAKSIVENIGIDIAKEMVARYFASNDPFILQAGYSLAVFKSQINKLQQAKPMHTSKIGAKFL